MTVNIVQTTIFACLLCVLFSCNTPTKSDIIPLESVDKTLISVSQTIVDEILTSFKSELGAKYLLDTPFITPKIHGGIMMNQVAYYESYQYVNLILGELSSVQLYKVRNLPYIKRMCYSLKSSEPDISEVKLFIDINDDFKLAGYYLYAEDTKKLLKDKNLLPRLKMK